MHYWSCNLLNCTTSWYNGLLLIQLLMLWTIHIPRMWMVTHFVCFQYWHKTAEKQQQSFQETPLFFLLRYLSHLRHTPKSPLASNPSTDSAALHALKWEKANDSAEIPLRTMAFNLCWEPSKNSHHHTYRNT